MPDRRRQPSTGEVCRVAGRGALGRRSESDGRARSSRAGSYIPIDRHGANLFFQLVSRRYERGAIILTSNQSLGAWGDVFGDPVIASAILDRLLHHATTINIKGESYRLKERRRAGLLTTPRADLPAVSKGERLSLADAERK